jgi:ATP diphosphatase
MILDQIIDECSEVRQEIDQGSPHEKLQKEIGDVLQSIISLCIFSWFSVEENLGKTHAKFSRRLSLLKELAQRQGLENLHGQTTDFLLSFWTKVKKTEYTSDGP